MLSIYINEVIILLSGTNIDSCVIIQTLLIFSHACINESVRQLLLLQQQKERRMSVIMMSDHGGKIFTPFFFFLLFMDRFNLPLAFSFSVWFWRHCQHILLILSQATCVSENIFRSCESVRQVTSYLRSWAKGEKEKGTEKKEISVRFWWEETPLFFFFIHFSFPAPTLIAVSLSSFSIVNKVFFGL